MKTLTLPAPAFAIRYAPELTPPQYVVQRGEATETRVVPTPTPFTDPEAKRRAVTVCDALNRVYGQTTQMLADPNAILPPDISAGGSHHEPSK